MEAWIDVAADSDFSLQNLPYGVFSTSRSGLHIGVAIGEYVLDLTVLAQDHVFSDVEFDVSTLEQPTLNAYAALGKEVHRAVRSKIQRLLQKDTQLEHVLRDNDGRRQRALILQSDAQLHLPMRIGDYTDFFVGLHHAVNVSCGSQLLMGQNGPAEKITSMVVCRYHQARRRNRGSLSFILSPTRCVPRN